MEMYQGNPPRFQVRGVAESQSQAEHSADLWNYFFRGIHAFAFVAKAFGEDALFNSINKFRDEFVSKTSANFQSNEWNEI
jgi:hypothetical protein